MLDEVLLPDDKIGSYDIEHMRQFWILQKARNEQQMMIENESLKDQVLLLKETIGKNENDTAKQEEMEKRIAELEEKEKEIMA